MLRCLLPRLRPNIFFLTLSDASFPSLFARSYLEILQMLFLYEKSLALYLLAILQYLIVDVFFLQHA